MWFKFFNYIEIINILFASLGSQKNDIFAWRSQMKKRILVLTAVILGLSFQQVKAQVDTARVGIFVLSLYNLDLNDKSFTTDFWIWLNHDIDSISFENSIEIPNAKETDYSMYLDEPKGGGRWITEKVHAVVKSEWDISDFPFDKQVLSIMIEEADKDTTELVYVADVTNSKIDEELTLKDWIIKDFKVTDTVRVYNSSYGDPTLTESSAYGQVRADITLQRIHVWTIFFKLFTGVFVGFLIALFVFFIKPVNVDPRFGLCVGGLFAAVGNKYVVEGTVSSVSSNTLIDTLHNLTFISILVIIFISIISLYLFEKGGNKNLRRAKMLDTWSFVVILVSYIGLAFYFVRQAIHG
jgi:hypothetical protein